MEGNTNTYMNENEDVSCRNASLSSLKLYLDEGVNGGVRETRGEFDVKDGGCDSNGFDAVEFAACEALLEDVNVIIDNDVKKMKGIHEQRTVNDVRVDERESDGANKSAAVSEERGSAGNGVSFAALHDTDDMRFDEGMLAAMHGTIISVTHTRVTRRVTCTCLSRIIIYMCVCVSVYVCVRLFTLSRTHERIRYTET